MIEKYRSGSSGRGAALASAVAPPAGHGQNRPADGRWSWLLASILAALLLLLMLGQLPRIADWSLFAFYDPGSILKADWLITAGMRPAIDFGYTHGLASLWVGHWGFALLGRTPAAYLVMTAVLEVLMAPALARFAAAMRFNRRAVVFLLCALPVAIMAGYLTLTHVLEALLLIWALAMQAQGRRTQALAITTACLFVKPSMAYVYGLLLVIWTLWEWLLVPDGGNSWAGLWKRTWPAVATAAGMAVAIGWRFGWTSLALTIVPITGMRTYRSAHFGFFSGSGPQFWSPLRHQILYYVFTPAGIWLLTAAILVWCGLRRGLRVAGRFPVLPHRRTQTLISMAVMQTAFVLGFYGWTKSWEYYSYLNILFTAAMLAALKTPRRGSGGTPGIPASVSRLPSWVAAALCVLAVLSQGRHLELAAGGWCRKLRTTATGDLWAYPSQLAQWKRICALTAGQPTLVLSNGYLPWMSRGMTMPSSWFPEPGIPTAPELGRVRHQVLRAIYVVTWNAYGPLDLWNQPSMAAPRRDFRRVRRGEYFSLWARSFPHAP